MPLSSDEWHHRFLQQARWTSDLRRYLYARAGMQHARRVLEVGCGTGALLAELPELTTGLPVGLDIKVEYLQYARQNASGVQLTQGDALMLPFASQSFDLVFCHYFLLWVSKPIQAVSEMARVSRAGGSVLALAEPDYGGRMDYPEALAPLGQLQADALLDQGADPTLGRRLGEIFHRSGLDQVELGVMGGQWRGTASREEQASEWSMLRADLDKKMSEAELNRLQEIDAHARQGGERVLYVPTFYALGRVAD